MLSIANITQRHYAMNLKLLIAKLETFFLAMTLVDGCQFKRGLRVRPKSAKPAATGKLPI